MSVILRTLALPLVALALAACPSTAQPPAPSTAVAAPAGPRFDVAIEAPTRGTKGSAGEARIVVSPRAPWHVNLDYAPKLTVTPTTGVEFDRVEQRADQAARFDADGLAFVLPFRMQDKGAKHIAGELHFAMCANDACAPESVPVDFTIDVGCDTDTVC
jgi:hypothetical protein